MAARFAPPVQVDEGQPVGWPAVSLLDDGGAVISWLERRVGQDGVGDVRVRHVRQDGTRGPSVVIATTTSGRTVGMPQMVRIGNRLVLAWRHDDRIHSAIVDVARTFRSSQ